MKMRPFWDVAPCSLIEIDRRFRDAYCLHHQGNNDASLKRLYTSTRLHGAISKMAYLIIHLC
jgi:hypothetical protein